MHDVLMIEELLKSQNEKNNVQESSLFFYIQKKLMTVHFNICIHWDTLIMYDWISNLLYARLCYITQERLHAWARNHDQVSSLFHLFQILIHKINSLWLKIVSELMLQIRITRTAHWKWLKRELNLLWFDVNIAVLIDFQRKIILIIF